MKDALFFGILVRVDLGLKESQYMDSILEGLVASSGKAWPLEEEKFSIRIESLCSQV